MIKKEEIERLHEMLISEFGGSQGIRDVAALNSALARPFQTFDGKELYPNPNEKAA